VALSTPGDRNLNGTQVAQAIAGALSRIGIRTTVNAVPLEVYLSGWRKNTFSMILHGAGPQPVAALLVPQMVGTKDPKTALGVSNESGYGNAALDAIMRGAFAEIDDGKRAEGLRAAARIVRGETAIVPLHHEFVMWASRPGLGFAPRMDSLTFVQDVTVTP
jgi:peptide/nickel transport system substrate-binding protein